jgi:hypothetical protein
MTPVHRDHTDWLLPAVAQLAQTFEDAIGKATTVDRCCTLRERITVCIGLLEAVEKKAFERADVLLADDGHPPLPEAWHRTLTERLRDIARYPDERD